MHAMEEDEQVPGDKDQSSQTTQADNPAKLNPDEIDEIVEKQPLPGITQQDFD